MGNHEGKPEKRCFDTGAEKQKRENAREFGKSLLLWQNRVVKCLFQCANSSSKTRNNSGAAKSPANEFAATEQNLGRGSVAEGRLRRVAANSFGVKLPFMLPRLNRTQCALLIVDVQTRLLPEMWEAQRVERNLIMLCTMARRLEIPIIASEQNPEKLGHTVASVREAIGPFSPRAKMSFSAFEAVKDDLNRSQILLCGLESHICVSQTALDLIDNGKTVFAVYDAISSRQNWNRQIGWERMKGAGALPSSTESALYELLREAGTEDFRAMLSLVK